jgi:hypothetical protein
MWDPRDRPRDLAATRVGTVGLVPMGGRLFEGVVSLRREYVQRCGFGRRLAEGETRKRIRLAVALVRG